MPGPEPRRLLILAGTGEAAALARAAAAAFSGRLEVINSLSGRFVQPGRIAGAVRIGGFGGAKGLADYLRGERIDMVVDATHPFAQTISANACEACASANVPRLVLTRPRWRKRPADRWIEVDDMAEAAAELRRRGGRALITIGVKELHQFANLPDVFCLVRLIELSAAPLPLANYEVVTGRGPFTVAAEKALLAGRRIDVVVSKASGGKAIRAKITAARAMNLPVIMVRRPPDPEGERTSRIPAALGWIAERLYEP